MENEECRMQYLMQRTRAFIQTDVIASLSTPTWTDPPFCLCKT